MQENLQTGDKRCKNNMYWELQTQRMKTCNDLQNNLRLFRQPKMTQRLLSGSVVKHPQAKILSNYKTH